VLFVCCDLFAREYIYDPVLMILSIYCPGFVLTQMHTKNPVCCEESMSSR